MSSNSRRVSYDFGIIPEFVSGVIAIGEVTLPVSKADCCGFRYLMIIEGHGDRTCHKFDNGRNRHMQRTAVSYPWPWPFRRI